jgi:hypothetical protein
MADDFQLRSYQDDLDTEGIDPAMDELGEHPADELGIPQDEYGEEIEKLNIEGDPDSAGEDAREDLEDKDQELSDTTSSSSQ